VELLGKKKLLFKNILPNHNKAHTVNHKRNCNADSKDDSKKMPNIYKTRKTHSRIQSFSLQCSQRSLYWAKVSQSIAGACCTLGISTLPGYPRWEKEAVWRPTITWRRTTAKELASAHLSWSEAQLVAAGGILCRHYASHGIARNR